MTKRKDTKAKAFTCRGAAALITAALLAATVLLTGCPQSPENQTQTPAVPPGPDPNLRIEGGVLKGYNKWPSGTLVIPAGVTEIAREVFWGCTSLTQVSFPASLTKIGEYAFSGCAGLTQVNFSAALIQIGSYAFSGCAGLTSLNLPASLETLNDWAFYGCTEITGTVAMPASLKTINMHAFYNCNKVDAFDFSHCTQLTAIGGMAFFRCTKITAMNLPASLETISASAFDGCTALATLTVDAASTHLSSEDNIIYDFNKTKLLCCAPNVTQVTFPATLTEIVDYAFSSCRSLTQVNFPASLTKIGRYAFDGCKEIAGTVTMPASLKTIGTGAFYNCKKVDSFDFSHCTQLTDIGSGAFEGCTGLTSLTLPASLEMLRSYAFSGCTEITGTVTLPANLKTIGTEAFYNCNKVDAFDFTQCTQLTFIGSSAFGNCKADAVFTVKKGSNIKNYLLNSQSGIKASQIREVP